MLLIHSRHFPRGSFHAINLCGLIFVNTRHGRLSARSLRHEAIHSLQQREMLYVGFFLWYAVEWGIRLVQCRFRVIEAYRCISMEREAYAMEGHTDYLRSRRPYSWTKFLFKEKK